MRKFKKKQNEELDILTDDLEQDNSSEDTKNIEEDEFNPNGLETVIDRVEHGLVGTLKIVSDDSNRPIFKNGDYVHFIAPARLQRKDFVLYKSHDSFFIRRIIKFVDDDIYVAGDHEKEYHIIHKEDVVGKAIGRQRKKKYISFSLNPAKKFYTFRKVNLAKMRLGNRVMNYDEDLSQESYEIAMQNLEATTQNQQTQQAKPTPVYTDIDLDSELQGFLNPDELVLEIRRAAQPESDEIDENQEDEEVEYIEVEETEGNEEETEEDASSEEEYIEEDEEKTDEED